ncbi:DKNYY domain-containing protein [Candidatus Nomurabacteria bacterium]|nr:DKNYY domain-containing protein [Candidatus Nomurabacteria bacterium]USN44137.1 MAG: DKNYY domain-containing protein [Candidatus Woesearchaeota archaeon]
MKTKLLLAFTLFLFFSRITFAEDTQTFVYTVHENKVYYGGQVLEDADPQSFVALDVVHGSDYAKDKNYVYYKGQVVKDADPQTFTQMLYGYVTDKKNIFYEGNLLSTYDSFVIIDEKYAQNGSYVFYEGQIVPKANPLSLHPFEYGYYTDDASVFYNEVRLGELINFFMYNPDYAKTKEAIFYKGVLVPEADLSSFKVFFENLSDYAQDNAHVYYKGKTLENLESSTFQILNKDKDKIYIKDDYTVLYNTQTIPDAKANSFVVISSDKINGDDIFAYDANFLYCNGEKLEGSDAKTIDIENEKVTDKWFVYTSCSYKEGKSPHTLLLFLAFLSFGEAILIILIVWRFRKLLMEK